MKRGSGLGGGVGGREEEKKEERATVFNLTSAKDR